MNKKICWPRVLKNITYVLFPIFLTILVLLIVCLSYPLERHAIKEGLDYYETNTFAENYALEIFSSLNAVTFLKDNNDGDIFSYEYIQTEGLENDDEANELNYYYEYYSYQLNIYFFSHQILKLFLVYNLLVLI